MICAYSEARWHELEEAVRSVEWQTRPARDLVIVIDHNDRLLQHAQSRFWQARVVASEGTRGLSAARNTGLSHVAGTIVAFLDDDACAAPDWLQALADAFADQRTIGAGGWIEPRWGGSEPRWLAPEVYWIIGCSYRGLPHAGTSLRNPIGANMAFRRTVLTELGGFREGIGRVRDRPLGDEETAVGIEANARWPQARIVHVPAARVQHAVPAQRATWRYLISRCWYEGRCKALLARTLGASDALSSERTYVMRVLPAGVLRGLRDYLSRRDASGLGRAASIIAALSVTAAGYLFGALSSLGRGTRGPASPVAGLSPTHHAR